MGCAHTNPVPVHGVPHSTNQVWCVLFALPRAKLFNHVVGENIYVVFDNDKDTQRKSIQLSLEAWPYRRECRGHNPTKKSLLQQV